MASQDEQLKYHQQMLCPSAGVRNYGFSDDFMMYTFKVEQCKQQEKHARGSCPFAHPGDVAQRRHPKAYQALLCPEVRAKKICPRAADCQCSHSAFEFWLHPDRYRTSMCEKGERCSRPVCFFAHTPKELRSLPAGLQPALHSPQELGRPSGTSRVSSSTGTIPQSPHAGFPAPGLHSAAYLPGVGLHDPTQQLLLHNPLTGLPAAGHSLGRHSAVAAGSYRAFPRPSTVEIGLQAPSHAVLPQMYTATSPLLSHVGLQEGSMSPLLQTGTPAAAVDAVTVRQYSAAGVTPRRGGSSSDAQSRAGDTWQPSAQQVQLQHMSAQQGLPAAAGMTYHDPFLQQLQQLNLWGPGPEGQAAYVGSHCAVLPGTAGGHAAPAYGQHLRTYSPAAAGEAWGHAPGPLMQQQWPTPGAADSKYALTPVHQQHMQPAVAAEHSVAAAEALAGGLLRSTGGTPAMVAHMPGGTMTAVPAVHGPQLAAVPHQWAASPSVVLAPSDILNVTAVSSQTSSTSGLQSQPSGGRW